MTTGSKVLIAFPPGETTVTAKMKKFDRKVTTISRVITKRVKTWATTTYTLKECNTEFGLPYEFLREWLVPLDGEGA